MKAEGVAPAEVPPWASVGGSRNTEETKVAEPERSRGRQDRRIGEMGKEQGLGRVRILSYVQMWGSDGILVMSYLGSSFLAAG